MAQERAVFLAQKAVRLFKRTDRPSRFWQAAFRRSGEARPLVKSTGQADLEKARAWALAYLGQLNPVRPEADTAATDKRDNLLGTYPFPRIRQEKRHVERELALRLLEAYRQDPYLSQRRLAEALDVSLAVVNHYTARATSAGYLVKLDRPEGRGAGYRYLLTEAGNRHLRDLAAAFLDQGLAPYRRLRAAFAGLLDEDDDSEIVIIGAGALAEIGQSVLADAGRAALLVVAPDDLTALTRHAVKRHHRRLTLWLATLADSAEVRALAERHLPGVRLLSPALI
jgi:hypothetical protein